LEAIKNEIPNTRQTETMAKVILILIGYLKKLILALISRAIKASPINTVIDFPSIPLILT
jgi:hypothetical protein